MRTCLSPARLAVVGSLNLDLVTRVARLPGPGETLLADGYRQSLGGKGANQAVSAVRHGVDVAMIACVGDDPEGARLTARSRDEGVDVTGVAGAWTCRPASRTSPSTRRAPTRSSSRRARTASSRAGRCSKRSIGSRHRTWS